MSFNNVQERDLVIAIKESSDEAFVLKKDLEDTKITLNQLAPGVNFKPYAVHNGFIRGAQSIATIVHTQVIQNLAMNVVDAAQDPDCSVKEKAEEAEAYIKKLGKTQFTLDTIKSTSDFSSAVHSVSNALDDVTARLGDTAKDQAKLKQLSVELASLKSKKADAESKKPTPGQELLNGEAIGQIIDEGNKTYDESAKGGQLASKNPLGSAVEKFKGISDKLPGGQNTRELQSMIEQLADQIAEIEGQIRVTKSIIEKSERNARELADVRESLAAYDERFKVLAEKLNRLHDFAKTAEAFVQEYKHFLASAEAGDRVQLERQTQLLKQRSDMLQKADTALTTFTSRVVA